MVIDKTASLLVRLPIAFSFLGHGIVRIPKIVNFAEAMAQSFNQSILPVNFVLGFGYALPFIEFILGILIAFGIAMRKSSIGGVILICILIFGSSLQENWSGVATQMFYGLYFSLLYLLAGLNSAQFRNSPPNIT